MAVMDDVNAAFAKLLATYTGGISNTSTTKYDEIKAIVAAATGIPVDGIYATGAASRVSNLDTRYAQGNQRGQHAPLALAFIGIRPGDGKGTRAERIAKFTESAFTTSRKFVDGEERGTTFDGILVLIQFENEQTLVPALLAEEHWDKKDEVVAKFGIQTVETVTRPPAVIAVPAAAPAGGAAPVGPAVGPLPVSPDLVRACAASLRAAGVRLPDGVLLRFLAALLSKRFVILQGLSGSGKSLLALAVAKWFQELEDQLELVAVGADWTSNEHVLGYQDALDKTVYRRPTSGALDVLISAKADPKRPYFLILDEMNLSHVERYFADLLSAIESEQPIALHAMDGDIDGVPPRLVLPPNLFIVGTVNVDETTYAFSPKVLDRANVIEFRLSRADLAEFIQAPTRIDLSILAGKGAAFSAPVAAAVEQAVSVSALQPPVASGPDVAQALNDSLLELFDELAKHGWEFGFRPAGEIHRFVYWHAFLTPTGQAGEPAAWALKDALDAQMVQKIMPKLHGSERRLRPVLELLTRFATKHGLPLTLNKVQRMTDRVRDGFTSFAEA